MLNRISCVKKSRLSGVKPFLIDVGVIGEVNIPINLSNDEVARAGGSSIQSILKNPTRQNAIPILIAAAIKILNELIVKGEVHSLIALGGSQGTTLCTQVMQALPYGFPKIIWSTVASGNTAPFVDIKDITMMFSGNTVASTNIPLPLIIFRSFNSR